MKIRLLLVYMVLVNVVVTGSCFGDVLVTFEGEEIQGKVLTAGKDTVVLVRPGESEEDTYRIPVSTLFMIKYSDGRKRVFGQDRLSKNDPRDTVQYRFRAGINAETGLFGLVNIDEEDFDAGIFTLGVTPVFEWQFSPMFSCGVEYMLLRAKPKKADESRFIMNMNGFGRLTFPLREKLNFHAMLGAGLSIWPEGEGVYEKEPTFFEDRIGWDFHGGIGIEYQTCSRGAILFTAAYNANSSIVDDIPVTIDMLMVSIGPRIRF